MAGIDPKYFEYITTFENSSYCKPNIMYYFEISTKLNLQADECIMVVNDVQEDMILEKIRMPKSLITQKFINKHNLNIDKISKGTLNEFLQYIKNEISIN